jgi:hypothetical protein
MSCKTWTIAVLAAVLAWPVGGRVSGEVPEAARERLQAMSAAEKLELEAKRSRFYNLTEHDQRRLREVHQELCEAEDGQRLRQVMQNYSKWLKSLQSGVRAELVTLPPESRVEKIKELLQEQENWRMRKYVMPELTPDDRKVIVRWMEEYVAAHEEEILQHMSPHWRSRWDSYDAAERLNRLIFAVTTNRSVRELLLPDEQQMEDLKSRLSPTARKELDLAEREKRLGELAERWLRAAMIIRHAPPQVSREELQRFYSGLDARQREYFESMSAERMEQELTRFYHFSRFRRFSDADRTPFVPRPGEGGWGGRSRGGRPGGERPPGPPPGERPGKPPFMPPGPGGPPGPAGKSPEQAPLG